MDTFIPLTTASQITHIPEPGLHQLIHVGKIRSVMTQTGEILVAEKDIQAQPTRETFAHLVGQGIGQREAGEKYGVRQTTISRWVHSGRIKVIQSGTRGQKMLIDEADVAYESARYLINPGRGRRTDKF